MLLVAVMVSTMALGAFPIVGTAVVATFLARDLGMSLTLFGAGVAVNTLFGAIFAPLSGQISDRHGGKWSCVLVLTSAGNWADHCGLCNFARGASSGPSSFQLRPGRV